MAHAPIRVVTFVEFLYDLTTAASNGQAYGDTLREELKDTTWPESKKKVFSKDFSGHLFHFLDKVAVCENVSGKACRGHGQLVYALNKAYLLSIARARKAGQTIGQHGWMHLKPVFDQLDKKDSADIKNMSNQDVVEFIQALQGADEQNQRQEVESENTLLEDEDQNLNKSKGRKEFVAMLGDHSDDEEGQSDTPEEHAFTFTVDGRTFSMHGGVGEKELEKLARHVKNEFKGLQSGEQGPPPNDRVRIRERAKDSATDVTVMIATSTARTATSVATSRRAVHAQRASPAKVIPGFTDLKSRKVTWRRARSSTASSSTRTQWMNQR